MLMKMDDADPKWKEDVGVKRRVICQLEPLVRARLRSAFKNINDIPASLKKPLAVSTVDTIVTKKKAQIIEIIVDDGAFSNFRKAQQKKRGREEGASSAAAATSGAEKPKKPKS